MILIMLFILILLINEFCSFKLIVSNISKSYKQSLLQMSLKVALTRERGANNKLLELLTADIDCYEIPCIMFNKGNDLEQLDNAIISHDIVIITSPQAALVFLDSWLVMNKPTVKVVTVGQGTSKPLIEAGIIPLFEPSDSTAEILAREIPLELGNTVLYPSSALADNKLVDGLQERGFKVTRLNTYSTVPATWTENEMKLAQSMDIVTFASPSAIKTWVERVGNKAKAVVIGPTSAKAAAKYGFQDIYSPEEGSKGIKPWGILIRKIALNED